MLVIINSRLVDLLEDVLESTVVLLQDSAVDEGHIGQLASRDEW